MKIQLIAPRMSLRPMDSEFKRLMTPFFQQHPEEKAYGTKSMVPVLSVQFGVSEIRQAYLAIGSTRIYAWHGAGGEAVVVWDWIMSAGKVDTDKAQRPIAIGWKQISRI